jgi:hypothetical protein
MQFVDWPRFVVLSVLVATTTATTARAQGQNPSRAEMLFRSAREAMARGDFAAGCSRFAESQRLDPAPGTLLNVAQCEEKEGKLATSFAHLTEVLEALPKDDFRIPYAQQRIASLEPRLPKITVTLASESAGAHVFRDGVELHDESFGIALPVDPGKHVLIVRAAGHVDAREEITIGEGQKLSLVLHPGSVARTEAKEYREPGGARRALTIGAFAVGGAGVVTGAVTGLLFANAASTYRNQCDATGCSADGLSAASRAKTFNIVSPVAFGVGAIGIGTGTYLLLTSSRHGTPRSGGIELQPHVSTAMTGLSLTGGF